MRSELPTGTVTFLFTDIEGSTQLLQRLGDSYASLLAMHHRILTQAITNHHGYVVDTQGDSFFAVFPRAMDALYAAVEAQRTLAVQDWQEGVDIRVRMALHTGEPLSDDSRYVGMDVHRAARIGSAGHGRQVLLSESTYAIVKNDLPEGVVVRDLGEHRLKDLRNPRHLYQLVISDLPSSFPPLKTLDTLPNNLPIQLTSFIGRQAQIATVKQLLTTTRLLTLTGVGGTGKTRLALQVAAEVLDNFQDGAWFIELAPIANPDLVPQTVAQALQLHELAGRSALETVRDFVHTRELLLVLDNCEHLTTACAKFADELLRQCPKLRIVATSREPLGTAGEVIWSVPSLELPQDANAASAVNLEQFEAVQLFVERARAVQPGFVLGETNAQAIAQVCARLDGIPLALELAAARVRGMGVEQIAARLDQRFRLLTGGSRTALPRQRTLQAAIDWSHNLLTDEERVLLRRLAVFVGGWTLEAAEFVGAGNGLEANDILDVLLRLVDKSLVIAETETSEPRYHMLETIRQYAYDKLDPVSEAEPLRDRHARYFLQLAEQADSHLRGLHQMEWLHLLDSMRDNLRAALEWLVDTRQTEVALRMVRKLHWYWFVRGDHEEGRHWLGRVMAMPDAPQYAGLYAETLTQLAHHLYLQIRPKQAKPPVEQALTIARAQGDQWNTARALGFLGLVLGDEHNYVAAQDALYESMALFRELGDEWAYAVDVMWLGWAAYRNDDEANARALHEQALAAFRNLGDRYFQCVCLRPIGNFYAKQGDLQRGLAALRESLILSQQLGSKYETAGSLWRFAEASHQAGFVARAVCLYWASRNVHASIGAWQEEDEPELQRVLASCRAALEKSEFEQAEEQGRALTMEQAITLALAE